ncbi:hypothetical protein Tco_1382453 [Tanacetum coccineum]
MNSFYPTQYQLADIFTKPLDEPTFKRLIVKLDIILNTNNEVALLYPEHTNKDYFKCVSDFIPKCCLRKPFTRSPDMYKEYLGEFWYSATALENSKVSFLIPTSGIFREVGVNTFRNAIGAHYLAHSSKYVAPPSIDVVRQWFLIIRYGEDVLAKGTLKKSLIPPRWRLCKHILGGHHSQAKEETKGKGCSLHSIYLPADNVQNEGRICVVPCFAEWILATNKG